MMIFVRNDPAAETSSHGSSGATLEEPLTALTYFLQQLSELNWRTYGVTATGIQRLSHLDAPFNYETGRVSPTGSIGSKSTNLSMYSDDGYLYTHLNIDDYDHEEHKATEKSGHGTGFEHNS